LSELLNFIENKREEVVSELINLVKARTVNPPGDVSEGIEVVRSILDRYNVSYKIVEPVKGKKNLIAEVGDEDEKALILNGHIDVVPPGEKLEIDPFSAKLDGDTLMGRGTSDMKSGVIALIYAFLAHRNRKVGKVVLTIVADEETGGKYGVRYLIDNGLVTGDACLVAEPTGSLKLSKYNIVAGEKGNLWLRIRSHGKSAHGSMPMLGENAIKKISMLVSGLPITLPNPIDIPLDARDIVNNGKVWLDRVNEGAGDAIDHLTINIGTIRGGSKINIVPDKAEIEVDVRIPIGLSTDMALREVQEIVREGFDIEVIDKTEPSYTPANSFIAQIVRDVGQRFLKYEPVSLCMPATSDARFFRYSGIPTVNFGPGFLELAHTDKEFVYVSHVVQFSKMYAMIIEKFFQ